MMPDDYVIAIDYDKCTGCRTCELVCSVNNAGQSNPVKARIRIVKADEEGESIRVPVVCMKCIEPACKAVCPKEAIFDDLETGARITDKEKCIGCSACVYACPFGAMSLDRSQGHSFACSQCEGEPNCVKFCAKEAVVYLKRDEAAIRLSRSRVANIFMAAAGEEESGE